MTINVGVDLHKTQFTVFVRRGDGTHGQYATTEEGYQEFFSEVQSIRKRNDHVKIGVESTGNTRYFKNRMEKEGFEVRVINTLKFKVVNESVKKTDRHDAETIAEFLEKDMLPESRLCSEASEQLRRLFSKNQTLTPIPTT